MTRLLLASLLGTAVATGCGGHDFEPPSESERLATAAERYSAAVFDTVSWASDSARAAEGNEVYAARCARCHGPLGRGETSYAQARQLRTPSLVEPEWRWATELDSVRSLVFRGHAGGMPSFGVAGISPREIDGASYYILEVLRPDVLGR